MQVMPPRCLRCKYYQIGPQFIGDTARCKKWGEVPRDIFYKAKKCDKFCAEDKESR